MKAMHEKHHAGRKHRETGGVNEAREDLETHPEARTNAKKIDAEAEERKRGGKTEEKHHKDCKCHECTGGKVARKRGGHVAHKKEGFGPEHESTLKRRRGGMTRHHEGKEVGKVHGEHAKHHAGHKPRKSGGRASSNENPFSSARHGTDPKGHKTDMEVD